MIDLEKFQDEGDNQISPEEYEPIIQDQPVEPVENDDAEEVSEANKKEKDTLAAQKWREVKAQQEAFAKKGRKKTEEMPKVGRGNVAEERMAAIKAQQEAFAQKGVKKAEDKPKVGRGNILAQKMASIMRAQQAFAKKGTKDEMPVEDTDDAEEELNPQEAAEDDINTAEDVDAGDKVENADAGVKDDDTPDAGVKDDDTPEVSKEEIQFVKQVEESAFKTIQPTTPKTPSSKKKVEKSVKKKSSTKKKSMKPNKNITQEEVSKKEERRKSYTNYLRDPSYSTPRKSRDTPAWKLAAQEFGEHLVKKTPTSTPTRGDSSSVKSASPVFYRRRSDTNSEQSPTWKLAARDVLYRQTRRTSNILVQSERNLDFSSQTTTVYTDHSVTPSGTPKWKIAAMDVFSQHPNLPRPDIEGGVSKISISHKKPAASTADDLESKRQMAIEKFVERQMFGREKAAKVAEMEKIVNFHRD